MARFEWGVANSGYQWCEAGPVEDLVAGHSGAAKVRVLTPGFTLSWHRYYPLEETPALYRTFADVEPTEAGIQSFANRYGLLGLWESVYLDEVQPGVTMAPGSSGRGVTVQGESCTVWQKRIRVMRSTLMVWDALRRRDQETLYRWVLPKNRKHGTAATSPIEATRHGALNHRNNYMAISSDGDSGLFMTGSVVMTMVYPSNSPFRDGVFFFEESRLPDGMLSQPLREPTFYIVEPPVSPDVGGFALAWLQAQINRHISEYVTPYVGYVQEGDTAIPLAMQTMPKHLYGALWLQLALSVRGTEEDRQCRQCGTWFRVPAKARRSSTTYCSTRCRVKAARQRQASAMQGV